MNNEEMMKQIRDFFEKEALRKNDAVSQFSDSVINLAYQNNGGGDVLKIPAEFRYQYVYREGDGDPLDASN